LSGSRVRLSDEAAVDGKRKVNVTGRPVEVARARVLIEEKIRSSAAGDTPDVAMTAAEDDLPIITLAGHAFKDRDGLVSHIRQLQTSVTDGAMLGPEDAFFIFHLATRHPHFIEKMTAPVVGFKYGPHEAFQGSKCFFVVRADGSEEGISIMKCVEAVLPKRPLKGDGRGVKRERDDASQAIEDSAPAAKKVFEQRREITHGCVVIISGVPGDIPYEGLREFLQEYGDIRFVEIIRPPRPAEDEEQETAEGGDEAAEKLVGAAEKPVEAAEKQVGVAEKPVEATEKPVEAAGTPAAEAEKPKAEAAKPPAEGDAAAGSKPAAAEASADNKPAEKPSADTPPAEGDANSSEKPVEEPATTDGKPADEPAAEEKKAPWKPKIVQVRARFGDAESASKTVADLKELEGAAVTCRLLDGDEEKDFWERLWDAASKAKDKGKGKGKDKGKKGKGKGKDKGKKGKGKGKNK